MGRLVLYMSMSLDGGPDRDERTTATLTKEF